MFDDSTSILLSNELKLNKTLLNLNLECMYFVFSFLKIYYYFFYKKACGITGNALKNISEILKYNKTLTFINLSSKNVF